jgi:hypothetical protein
MPLAVLYARFSRRPNPDECDSVEKQLERCRAYCEGHGFTVVAEYKGQRPTGSGRGQLVVRGQRARVVADASACGRARHDYEPDGDGHPRMER